MLPTMNNSSSRSIILLWIIVRNYLRYMELEFVKNYHKMIYDSSYIRLARFHSFFSRFQFIFDESQFPRDLVRFCISVFSDQPRLLQLRHQLIHPFLVLLTSVLQNFADAKSNNLLRTKSQTLIKSFSSSFTQDKPFRVFRGLHRLCQFCLSRQTAFLRFFQILQALLHLSVQNRQLRLRLLSFVKIIFNYSYVS